MNFSPQNEQGLLGLISALKNGMDPNTAYSVFQNIQGDQAQQIALRQQRLSGLADLLTGAAQQGVPYAGAQAMAEAAPGPAGPAVQNMLSSLYPQGEAIQPAPPMDAQGNPLQQAPEGYYNPLGYGAQSMSPTMPPPPAPSMGEQVQAQQLQMQAELQPLWAELAQNAAAAAAEGKVTQDQFVQDAMRAYPELFGQDIQTAQQIILTAFHQSTPGA